MKGYLIDTQTVSYWFAESCPQHANVKAHVMALDPASQFRVSVVTIGEIEFGHSFTSAPDLIQQQEFRNFIRETFHAPLEISRFTPICYGEIRTLLFKKYPPKSPKHRRPEQCFDPITATELGIDENDLWIASQAYEHGLVLVTNDRMTRIRDVAGHLLDVENWTDPI